MRLNDATVLLFVSLIDIICADGDAADARMLAAQPTLPPRPNTLPKCKDPVTGKDGYEPVCPLGYFKCCATCKGAVCFSEKGLDLSWRGVRECIRCAPGDFCNGCDTYSRCPQSKIPGRKGAKISPPGSVRPQECEVCPSSYEADIKRTRCVKKWRDVCNEQFVGRCIRNCKAEEPKRMKNLNFCEQMKCQLYCAKRWSDGCAKAYSKECEYRMDGPSAYDITEGEQWLTGCNVDCNGGRSSRHVHMVVLLCCVVLALARMLSE